MDRKESKQQAQNKAFNWQKGLVALFCACLGISGLFPLITAIGLPRESLIQVQIPEEEAKLITVKVVAGEFWGSGILIAKKGNVYRVLTNAHVLSDKVKNYSIYTPDNKIYSGIVIARSSAFDGDDLAILEFVSQRREYKLARFGKTPQPGDEVFSSGFPFPQLGEKNKGWVYQKGVVWGMLKKPLQGGYQLGYTNQIFRGMSGGPLLNKAGEVVAVNGMHAHPLLGKPYIYKDGTRPQDLLIEEMVLHSWGIPIERIQRLK